MNFKISFSAALLICAGQVAAMAQIKDPQTRIETGVIQGVYEGGPDLKIFKGIPYAAPPIGSLRWKTPQAASSWTGIKPTAHFGPRAMQRPLFSDMRFRSNGMSEDCLYLNVWTPSKHNTDKLPVLVYFYGGGFVGGDGSEYRYDGAALAKQGIVTVTINYRLGVFGFLAHPELSKESPYHGSGNYGLMDQTAALRWVKRNIHAFGGDPGKVTIAGESAGSIAVFAQMASPSAKGLFAGVIGESGAMIKPTLPAVPLKEAELNGVKFLKKAGISGIEELRTLDPQKILQLDSAADPKLDPVIDGFFFTEDPVKTYEQGKNAQVPALIGWNSAESSYRDLIKDPVTPEKYKARILQLYPKNFEEILKLYPGNSPEEIKKSATDLASARFITYSTWKWTDLLLNHSTKPVYRYIFSRIRMTKEDRKNKVVYQGASHSSEIEYALGNLDTNPVYEWTNDDYTVSETMQHYFLNFIKTGNPNGEGLVKWDNLTKKGKSETMNIDVKSKKGSEPKFEQQMTSN